jgi:hypothetical protein
MERGIRSLFARNRRHGVFSALHAFNLGYTCENSEKSDATPKKTRKRRQQGMRPSKLSGSLS